jgi:hypothetical protein
MGARDIVASLLCCDGYVAFNFLECTDSTKVKDRQEKNRLKRIKKENWVLHQEPLCSLDN